MSWRVVLRPRWLAWHAFAVIATWGMLWLGDWQLHRALSGNELSWAYTFEWPLFTIFGIYFWGKTLRDEMRGGQPAQDKHPDQNKLPDQNNHEAGNGAGSSSESVTADAYVAHLKAEVQSHGRWHGWR